MEKKITGPEFAPRFVGNKLISVDIVGESPVPNSVNDDTEEMTVISTPLMDLNKPNKNKRIYETQSIKEFMDNNKEEN